MRGVQTTLRAAAIAALSVISVAVAGCGGDSAEAGPIAADVGGGDTASGDVGGEDVGGCTVDSECPSSGPCSPGRCTAGVCGTAQLSAGASCDDGDPCTSGDQCDAAGACNPTVLGQACDDGDPCNGVETCAPDGCKTGTPLTCDDGDPCNGLEACEAGKGCIPGEPVACDDTVLCTLDGAAGQVLTCPLRLAASNPSEVHATRLGFSLGWSSGVALDAVVETRCVGDVCAEAVTPVSAETLVAGGRLFGSLVVTGTTAAVELSSSTGPLSAAWLDQELLQGESRVLTFRFKLSQALSGTQIKVNALVAGADDATLTAALIDGLVVSTATPCGGTVCLDLNPCTTDTCNADVCEHGPATGACDDGNPCTTSDVCGAGGCAGTPAAQGAECVGANRCSEVGTCDGAGACIVDANLTVTCTSGTPCAAGACDPSSGDCVYTPVAGGCDDGDPCTEADACTSGVCTGAPTLCDDGISCTLDACEAGTGCASTPDDVACGDDQACYAWTCSESEAGCVAEPVAGACDDGDPCTAGDVCTLGSCAGAPSGSCGCTFDADCVAFDDSNPCTGTLTCQAGACKIAPDSVPKCPSDGAGCKVDWACNPSSGQCEGQPDPCDDGIACTVDSCSPTDGCQHSAAADCAVGVICRLEGAAGSSQDCVVRLAARSGPLATGANLTFLWDGAKATLENLYDTACIGPTCFEYPLAECTTSCSWYPLEPTQHSVVAVPKNPGQATGKFTALFYTPGSVGTPLSTATSNGLSVSGEAAVVVLRFTLGAATSAAQPLLVSIADVDLNASSGLPLPYQIVPWSDPSQTVLVTEEK